MQYIHIPVVVLQSGWRFMLCLNAFYTLYILITCQMIKGAQQLGRSVVHTDPYKIANGFYLWLIFVIFYCHLVILNPYTR